MHSVSLTPPLSIRLPVRCTMRKRVRYRVVSQHCDSDIATQSLTSQSRQKCGLLTVVTRRNRIRINTTRTYTHTQSTDRLKSRTQFFTENPLSNTLIAPCDCSGKYSLNSKQFQIETGDNTVPLLD